MDRQLNLDSRDVPTMRELSEAELDAVCGSQGVLFGLMQKVLADARASDQGYPGPTSMPYPNNP
jgi:hypothetical protein